MRTRTTRLAIKLALAGMATAWVAGCSPQPDSATKPAGDSAAAPAAARVQDVPGQDLSDVPQRNWSPFWSKRVTGYVKTTDGTELRYSALLPKGEGPFPVLLRYSGYDSGSIGGSSYLADNETFSVDLDKQLVEQGYAVVGLQARGTGCSQGKFDFLGPQYGEDGRDAVEFFAKQEWSNGNIGMFGWSWSGMSQLLTASHRPQGLKAIAPGMVLGDPRVDSWAPGGVPAPEFVTGWHWYLAQRWEAIRASAETENDKRCLAQLGFNEANIGKTAITYQVLRHPLRDEWSDTRIIRNRTHLIDVPVLAFRTWQDEAVMAREGYYHETLKPEQLWSVQSNGPHDLYESTHFREKLVKFFDHFVKGQDNGFDKSPHVEIWQETASSNRKTPHDLNETGAPGWTIFRDAEPEVTPVRFSLGSGGTLTENAKPVLDSKPDEYIYPVPGPDVNTYEADNAWGELHPDWKKGSLAYTSAPLERDLLTYGPGSADLWISAAMSVDADVQVTLTQLLPDGKEVFVQRGWLRLSTRKQDLAHSTELRPWRTDLPDDIQPLLPEEPVLGRVELTPFSHPFRKGSRIRIWIDAPGRTGGNGFDIFSLASQNSVWHDALHPSQLVLGELKETITAKQPACNTLLMQPCRKDPLAK
ncbi:MAG: CocE/NonD family hydrolase [Pseudoxanthomonas sp.]